MKLILEDGEMKPVGKVVEDRITIVNYPPLSKKNTFIEVGAGQ